MSYTLEYDYGDHDPLKDKWFRGKKFITNFYYKDMEIYKQAIKETDMEDTLLIRDVDCWGGRYEGLASLYKSPEITDLSDFWEIFRKLQKED